MLLVVMIVAAIFVVVKWDSVQEQVNAENETSGSTRVVAWERTFSIFDDHWLLGTGPAGYAFYFAARLSGFYQFSHNNYVDILAQLGILGITFFVLIWLAVNFISLSNYRYMSKDGGFRQGLAASLVAMNAATLLIMWLGDWVTPFTYTQGLEGIDYTIWPWIFAGLTLALYGQRHLTSEEILEQDKVKV
jgi:O-antigen ligase